MSRTLISCFRPSVEVSSLVLCESPSSFFGWMSRFSVTLTDLSVSPSITWSVSAVCSMSVGFSSSSAVLFSSSPSCNSCCSSLFSASCACVSAAPSEMLLHCYNYIQFYFCVKVEVSHVGLSPYQSEI
jgi:hypothetical protein